MPPLWGKVGTLWEDGQPTGVFDGCVDGFAELFVIVSGNRRADVGAVLFVVCLRYSADAQKLFRPAFAALIRLDCLGDGVDHITDAQILARTDGDGLLSGFQVKEVCEIAARHKLELTVVADIIEKQA